MDEVKIYTYALSPDDIKIEYDHGASVAMASSGPIIAGGGSATSARAEYCPPGNTEGNCASGQNPSPVGQWNFEEGTGTTAKDTSGNNNNGTLTNGPTWAAGKMGTGVNFDGVNDYINAGNFGTFYDQGTIAFWMNAAVVENYRNPFTTKYSGGNAGIRFEENSGGTFGVVVGNDAGTYTYANYLANGMLPNKWYHIVLVWDKTANNIKGYLNGVSKFNQAQSLWPTTLPAITIGEGYDLLRYWSGQIDQVRIYPYARTPAQIAWDYNRGGPVGWWKMDECQGATIHDSSGNANDGNLTVGASGTQTSAGTCTTASTAWGNGATGKFNSAMSFDGSDDYISFGNIGIHNNIAYSVSAWVKRPAASDRYFYSEAKSNQSGFFGISSQQVSPYNKVRIYIRDNDGTVRLDTIGNKVAYDNVWHHIIWSDNNGSYKLYIDGALDISGTYVKNIKTLDNARISSWSALSGTGGYFQGQIDDVRIYNYALTKEQIFNVMNGGASLKFGN